MSYSRKQLEAFGEPFGESATRKEAGRIVYGGGGSGGGGSSTQITDLPDWAKPYAQRTLENTEELTKNMNMAKYEAINPETGKMEAAPRIAGFSPMQQKAQDTAFNMGTSQLGQFGGQVAGAASLGALGTRYDPFRTGQFTSQAASQYMNPYVEQAMEPQLREAQRTSEMQRMADQAQAVRTGAFGGSRQAIVEAERQRNLGTQQGDIRARGYQAAFDRAQDQFGREQQLREQSRQYGAGLGMQGLQTAIQGAGQLGALGQQEFGQQKETVGLQSQLGAQQQALRQQGLTQAYQDFMNEQNYPYRQLGFMSDMIRGLPLGQQSTRQMYEAPGSMMGQLGGIGMGLYGMSRMGAFAEGGQVDEYADGGEVTSNYFVDNTLDKLSDVQLQQARLAAVNSQDQQRLQMIDGELAQRASLRSGLGSAFNTLPEETQESVTEMAGGGIVAFSDGGGIVAFSDGGDNSYATLERKRLEQPRPAPRARSAPQRRVSPAVHQGINQIAEQTGVPRETVEDRYARILKDIESKDAGDIKAIQDMVEKSTGGSREVKEGALGRALADFGFKWAAAAAKPGAKFLGSAAEASPTLAASAAESAKLAREMDQNDMKLRTAQRQFELSRRADNRKEAGVFAGQIEQLERQQEMLGLKRQELAQTGAYQQGSLANQRAQIARGAESDRLRGLSAAANLQRAQASILEVGRKAGLDFDNNRQNAQMLAKLTEQHGAEKAKYLYNQQRRAYISEATQRARAQAESDVQARSVFDLLSQE